MANFWIIQTGEPLHADLNNWRPMRAVNLADMLISRGHNVSLISSAFFHQEKVHRSFSNISHYHADNLATFLLPSPGYQRNIGFSRLFDHIILAVNFIRLSLRLFIKGSQKPDFVFIGYPPVELAFVATFLMNIFHIHTCLDIKDLWPSLLVDSIRPRYRKIFSLLVSPYYLMYKYSVHNSSCICSMTNEFIDRVNVEVGRKSSAHDIVAPLSSRPSPALALDPSISDWWRTNSLFETDTRVFSFVGSFMSVYDFSPIKEAYDNLSSKYPDLKLFFCGSGSYLSVVKELFSDCKNVHFPGWISPQQAEYIYSKSCGVFIPYKNIPNYYYNLPNKVMDCVSKGIPMISTVDGAISKLITDQSFGYVCTSSSGISVSEAMSSLIINPTLKENMLVNGPLYAEHNFSYNHVYTHLAERLESLLPHSK